MFKASPLDSGLSHDKEKSAPARATLVGSVREVYRICSPAGSSPDHPGPTVTSSEQPLAALLKNKFFWKPQDALCWPVQPTPSLREIVRFQDFRKCYLCETFWWHFVKKKYLLSAQMFKSLQVISKNTCLSVFCLFLCINLHPHVYIYVCTLCAGAHTGKKRTLAPSELELQKAV